MASTTIVAVMTVMVAVVAVMAVVMVAIVAIVVAVMASVVTTSVSTAVSVSAFKRSLLLGFYLTKQTCLNACELGLSIISRSQRLRLPSAKVQTTQKRAIRNRTFMIYKIDKNR